jgi:hypothetical protein
MDYKKDDTVTGEVVDILARLTGTEEKAPESKGPEEKLTEEEEEEAKSKAADLEEEEEEDEAAAVSKKNEEKKASTNEAPKSETDHYKTIKKLIDKGVIDDFPIQLSEDEDDVLNISEFTDMSEEQFNEIIDLHKTEKQNEIKEKYLSKEGLKDHQIKVFEILKNGGDFSEISDTPREAVQMPFEDFDPSVKQHSINVLFYKFMNQQGLSEEDARDLIKKRDQQGTLTDEAQKSVTGYHSAFNEYLDEKLADKQKEKLEKQSREQDNKKALTKALKEAGLKESVYKKVADTYVKKNSDGESSLISKLREILEEPDKYHSLIAHLADPKAYEEINKTQMSNTTAKSIQRLVTGSGKKGNRQTVKSQEAPKTEYESFADMFNQKN